MTLNKHKNFIIFALISTIVVICTQKFFYEQKISVPHSDAFWYIDYGLGLKDNNTFGYSHTKYVPSNVITPLYPTYIAVLLKLDDNLSNDLECLLKTKDNSICAIDLSNLAWFQCILALITFWCIWLIALEVFKSYSIAWTAFMISLLMGKVLHFANLILTEIMTITLFSLFALMIIKFFNSKRTVWMAFATLFLGLLTLTRPSYQYLYFAIVLLQILLTLIYRKKSQFKQLVVMTLVYLAVVGPWTARNYYHFEETALTSSYGDRVLKTRISYNRMSWQEWGVGFIYWFPDCGDSIARKLFPEEYYQKLSFNPGSYYLDDDILPKSIKGKPTEDIVDYLIKQEIFGNFWKHSLVTIVLTWRGMFIAKYWGVLGFICFLILILRVKSTYKDKLLFLAAPIWFMVFFHAFISLNIARYNLILIPLYSISIATIIIQLFKKIKPTTHSTEHAN